MIDDECNIFLTEIETTNYDPEVNFRVNIGFPLESQTKKQLMFEWMKKVRSRRLDPLLEKKSRHLQCKIKFIQN